jgi:hypothetical protein
MSHELRIWTHKRVSILTPPPLSLLPSIARRGRRGRPVWAAVVAGGGGADGHGVAGHSHGPPHLGQRWPMGCWPWAPTAGWERSLAAVWLGYRAVSAVKGLGGGAHKWVRMRLWSCKGHSEGEARPVAVLSAASMAASTLWGSERDREMKRGSEWGSGRARASPHLATGA